MGRWIAAIVFGEAAVLVSREWRVDRVEKEKEDLVVGSVICRVILTASDPVFLLSTFSPRLSIRRRRIGVTGHQLNFFATPSIPRQVQESSERSFWQKALGNKEFVEYRERVCEKRTK